MGELNEGGGGWEGISLFFRSLWSLCCTWLSRVVVRRRRRREDETQSTSSLENQLKTVLEKCHILLDKQYKIDTVVAKSFKTTTTTATTITTTMQRCFIASFALFYGDKLSKIAKSVLFVETRWGCRADANLYQFKCCFVFAMSKRKYMKTKHLHTCSMQAINI